MAMYIIEENHFGQLIQSAFNKIPTRAIPQITVSRIIPVAPSKTSIQTGVYVPAIKTKIIIWSNLRNTFKTPSRTFNA